MGTTPGLLPSTAPLLGSRAAGSVSIAPANQGCWACAGGEEGTHGDTAHCSTRYCGCAITTESSCILAPLLYSPAWRVSCPFQGQYAGTYVRTLNQRRDKQGPAEPGLIDPSRPWDTQHRDEEAGESCVRDGLL